VQFPESQQMFRMNITPPSSALKSKPSKEPLHDGSLLGLLAKLKSNGDKVPTCFKPFWIGKLSDKYLPIRTLLCKHILISLTSFMDNPNSMRILYNISLLTES
jgi:hypothetical protein